jgi:hypothetical protein
MQQATPSDVFDVDAACRVEVILVLHDLSSKGMSREVNLYFLGIAMQSLMDACRANIMANVMSPMRGRRRR